MYSSENFNSAFFDLAVPASQAPDYWNYILNNSSQNQQHPPNNTPFWYAALKGKTYCRHTCLLRGHMREPQFRNGESHVIYLFEESAIWDGRSWCHHGDQLKEREIFVKKFVTEYVNQSMGKAPTKSLIAEHLGVSISTLDHQHIDGKPLGKYLKYIERLFADRLVRKRHATKPTEQFDSI